MIKVSILYPNSENCRFDIDYYCNTHMTMVKDRLGDACKGVAVDKGFAGEAGSRPPYVAVGHLFFESVDAFRSAFGPHALEIFDDIPKYTDLQPIVQISEVLINATRGQTGDLHLHAA